MCKLCWSVSLLLLVVLGAMSYKLIYSGAVVEGSDGRESIQLTAGERDLVLTEMRTFLASVQMITQGLANDDMPGIAAAARSVGAAAQNTVPGSLVGKLPLTFKKLGFDTHTKFDMLARDSEDLGDREHALSQLATLMNNCVSCHATYRMDVAQD